jgi:hypothetical protein
MNNWISSDKEKPEIIGGHYSNRVLCHTTSGNMEVGYLMNGMWMRDVGGRSFSHCGYEVNFWQPLPEPPKTEQLRDVWDLSIN